MFEKSLSDLVRGIRAHKGQEHQYIAQCMTEIKKELKQENITVKATAVSKLTYLQMLGYDISWAAFNIIEVMSSTKFTIKRVGYLAAAQCFHEGVDVVMLTTNMIRKDISTHNQYDASLALNGLACFMTPDLARDLANDVLTLTASSRPYLRKKAILVMYKVFLKFPDALRPAFPRLKDRLDDPDTGVQCASVSVICELARKNPKNYLSLAPTFFKLMTNSTNNWMLIKIIKLFGALTPLEPRLGKKLIEPLTSLVHSTTAMSLLYECISTVVTGMPNHTASVQLCVSKLRLFVEDADQNLKYLGLLAMSKILQCQPKAVHQLKDLIVECLDDRDDSIRLRALDLISGMVTKKNLVEIVKKLMLHMDQSESTSYRDEVLSKIIFICTQNQYQYITNFEWYITVLVEMTRFESTGQGKLIASQMLDVTIRVKEVRPFSVRQMATILENTHLFTGNVDNNGICEVLYAASWIVGEFSEHLSDPRSTLDALLNSKVTALPGHIQAVFVQNIIKLYASILVKAEAEGTPEAVEEVGAMLVEKLPVFIQSGDLEVQERACCILQLMKYIVKLQSKGAAVADELVVLFAGDLNPVAPKAQRKVPVPEGLDLDKWINEPPSDSDGDQVDDAGFFLAPSTSGADFYQTRGHASPASSRSSKRDEQEDDEDVKRRREQRRQDQINNPHYLKSTPSSKASPRRPDEGGLSKMDVSSIPVSKLELGVSLVIDEPTSKKDKRKKKKKRKGRKGGRSSEEETVPRPSVDTTTGEMPEGAVSSSEEVDGDAAIKTDDLSKALNQNLDVPLRDDEVLPVRQHRVVAMTTLEDEEQEPKKKKGKDKHKKKRKSKEGKATEEGEEGEGEKKPKEHRKKRKGSKKHHRHHDADKDGGGEASLVDIATEDTKPPEENEQPMPLLADDIIVTKSTKEEDITAPRGDGDIDDLEFWLSAADAPTQSKAKQEPPAATGGSEPQADKVPGEEGGEVKPKKKKEKKPRKDKKGGRKHKSKQPAEGEGEVEQPPEAAGGELLDLDLAAITVTPQPAPSSFKLLAEDENLKMTYEVRANPLYSGQVTVAVVFSNQATHQLVSLEFNVLDSLNTKMERPMGSSAHDGIKVPFQLPPETANECQFIFYVQSFLMPQKLRGTVTYMVKSDEGTASDKLDFTISLPCSAFICPVPCSQQQFASLLSSGGLCDTQTVKAPLVNTSDFGAALSAIVTALHLTVLEHIDESASLYGCSIANQHVCLLVKSVGGSMLAVNAKSSDSQLVSNLLDEVKTIV